MDICINIYDGDAKISIERNGVEELQSVLALFHEALQRMTFTQVLALAAEWESGNMTWSDGL